MNISELPNAPGFLTVGEAARRLGSTYRDVYRLIDNRRLPAVRIGARLLVATAKVEELAGPA